MFIGLHTENLTYLAINHSKIITGIDYTHYMEYQTLYQKAACQYFNPRIFPWVEVSSDKNPCPSYLIYSNNLCFSKE